jgi:LAO/AO transport system ATPase
MFLRHKIRKKDGKRHRYWSVVENKRVAGGRVVQKHVLHLGEINDSQELACRYPNSLGSCWRPFAPWPRADPRGVNERSEARPTSPRARDQDRPRRTRSGQPDRRGFPTRRRYGRDLYAADPSSPISGGSVLGDRIRMQRHTSDTGVFIRSIASRGHLGGLSESIHRIVDLMDASGRDVVIIETVGAGQSEVEVAEIADICVVVNAPNLGDDVQAIKAGILEIADILVVNKADMVLARLTTDQLKSMLKLRADNQNVSVIETVATTGKGVEGLVEAVEAQVMWTAEERQARRGRRIQRLVAQLAGRRVRDYVMGLASAEASAIFVLALEGHIGIAEAAERVLGGFMR